MKKTFFITLLTLTSVIVSAQTGIGVDYYYLGEYDAAKRYFERQLNQSPAESYFYLGEIAFVENNLTEAKNNYEKGLAADPTYAYNEIGVAKVLLKSDPRTAESNLTAIQRKNRRDANVILAIARAYFDAGFPDKGKTTMEEARKRDRKNPQLYILEGDVLKAETGVSKLGEVTGHYNMAIRFEPNFRLAYIKAAQTYALYNPNSAIDQLKKIIELQPDYLIAYRELGTVSTQVGLYRQAIEAFETYFAGGEYSVNDLERFARVLYFSELYSEAQQKVTEGLNREPNHFVMNRYQLFIYSKTHNYQDGLPFAEKFFSLRNGATGGYLAIDYTAYGSLLKDAQLYNDAVVAYNKAYAIDPKDEYILEIVEIGKEKKDFGLAASYYNKYITAQPEVTAIYLNQLGFYYYNAGNTSAKDSVLGKELVQDEQLVASIANSPQQIDTLKSNPDAFSRALALHYLQKADSVFDLLIAEMPESYSGYRWKALTALSRTPDIKIGESKPYYEKVVEIITAKEEKTTAETRVLLEAYSYIAYNFYLNEKLDEAANFSNEILKIDPSNANANAILEGIKAYQENLKKHREQQRAAAAAAQQ